MCFKDAGEVAEVGKAELVAHFGNAEVFVFKKLGGFLHSGSLVVCEEALAEGLFKDFAEFGFAHAGLAGESGDVGWLVQIV